MALEEYSIRHKIVSLWTLFSTVVRGIRFVDKNRTITFNGCNGYSNGYTLLPSNNRALWGFRSTTPHTAICIPYAVCIHGHGNAKKSDRKQGCTAPMHKEVTKSRHKRKWFGWLKCIHGNHILPGCVVLCMSGCGSCNRSVFLRR